MFLANKSFAVNTTGEATVYKITMTYLELCVDGSNTSTCSDPLVVGSGDSGAIDIAATTAGAAAASYGDFAKVPFGKSYTKNQLENIAYLILHYESNKIVHVNCSWISPIKIRTMIIGGLKKMLVFDDVQQKKIRIYNKNLDDVIGSIDKEYVPPSTNDDFFEPEFSSKEALLEMTEDFVNSIINNKIPLSNGDLA